MSTREKVKLIVAISDAGKGEKMTDAMRSAGAMLTYVTGGQGTATPAWLEYLGLTETRKDVAIGAVGESRAHEALAAIRAVFYPNDHYIAFSIPVNSVAGASAYQRLKGKEV